MVLGFKKKFNNVNPFHGKETKFVEKILLGLPYANWTGYDLGIKFKDIWRKKGIKTPKIHTIRKSNRWSAGRVIHFATGVRTKNYWCFAKHTCVSVQKIKIYRERLVIIDGKALSTSAIDQLALNDGFDSTDEFFAWFEKEDFHGYLIHWTDKKY